MSLKDLDIGLNYESGKDNIISSFYIPVLNESIQYDRIAGFFSSSSLAIAARGIAGLIVNNGRMRLIVSPKLNESDIKIINDVTYDPSNFIENKMIKEIEYIENTLERDHVYSLGWLLAHNMLEIKVAIIMNNNHYANEFEIIDSGIFHQKVGVLKDSDGNYLSFSGSINETAAGWMSNIEEFKTFRSWEKGQQQYCINDINKFEEFWTNSRDNVKVVSLPEAVKNTLIKNAVTNPIEALDFNKYNSYGIAKENEYDYYSNKIVNISLFEYQKNAVNMWSENDYKLMLEMATGTGKTRTAIACINKFVQMFNKCIVVISCPQNTLSLQWKTEIEKLGLKFSSSIIADSTNRNWFNKLEEIAFKIKLNLMDNLIVYTTHATSSSDKFISIIKSVCRDIECFFVGDEVHGLGANISKHALLDYYHYRLGLSATPRRWFDDEGTNLLYDYFSNKTFVFGIKDALSTINPITGKTFLVNYNYFPYFIELNDEEIEKYVKLSKKISKLNRMNRSDDEYSNLKQNLLFKRADIHKSADNKYKIFENILDEICEIKDLLVFVSPQQIDNVMKILKSKSVISHRFTQLQGTTSSLNYNGLTERQYIIDNFKQGLYKALVAIKCLDEGIDIPNASNAILLSSSSNPREYIQRIGRVIRQAEGKTEASIYDIIIKPSSVKYRDKELVEFEKKVFLKELMRVEDIAENAINNADAMKQIYDIKREVL